MRVCAYCQTTRFGLTMPTPILTFNGRLCFCTTEHKEAYLKDRQQRVRAAQHQEWLKAETSTG
jgi:hypothetical protein